MTNTIKYKVAVVVVLATIFGFASGVVGEIIARVYIIEQAFNIPLFGDINFQDNSYGASSLVIRNPSKVIVEQNTKIEESKNAAKRSIVGIFRKNEKTPENTGQEKKFDINNYYQYYDELGNGLIVTSDGWIATDFIPEKMQDSLAPGKPLATSTKKSFLDEYVVITDDKKIYDIDEIIFDPGSLYSFWHINANDLPVKNLIDKKNIQNGELVLAVNWDGWTEVSFIVSKEEQPALVNPSGGQVNHMNLSEKPLKIFYGTFLFNLNNEIAGLINAEGEILPTDAITPALNSLLSNRKIDKIDLGFNYINLSDLIKSVEDGFPPNGLLIYKNEKGEAVSKGGPADSAGLAEGDIITSVDNIVLDGSNTLDGILDKHLPGDVITLYYIRNDKKLQVQVTL